MDSQNSTLESDLEAENVKVFVVTPSDLASIGLVTKVENGQAVLLPAKETNNVDTSTTLSQIIARKRSLSLKDVAIMETPLEIASSSASASPSIVRNPKRKEPDEQDVTITIVKQNDINNGLNVATAKNLEDVTVTVSKLAPASTSVLRSDVTSPQIKRRCGNAAHRATSLLANATNSPQMRTINVKTPRGPATELSNRADASHVKTAGGNNLHENTNVVGKGVIVSPVKTGSKTNYSKPYEGKEKWTPNLIKRTCKLIPMKKAPLHSPASSSEGSADGSSYSNTPVKTRGRRMVSGFAQYWLDSLEEVGYIRCPLRACNYISLSYQDMSAHYATCAGVSVTSDNMCPVCQKRLNTAESVKLHLIRSHGPKSKHQEVAQSEPSIKREPKEDPPPRLLVRKRGYSKVHKVSWSISLEQKGYIECLFQNCGFLALNMEEMIKHYGICNGSGSSAHIPCPFCNGRVENLDKLDKHILRSHAEESKKPDTQTETINVVGTPEVKPSLSQNSHDQRDSQQMTVGQSATPESFTTNVSELSSHQIGQAQKTTEYIVPEMLYEDFENRVNSVKSFSNLPTKNGTDSLENLITGSNDENNFLVPEKQKDSVSIRLSDGQSTHFEVVGTESNHSREKISDKRYNVQISETVVVSVDPQDITEMEGISANRLATEVGYETISLDISDITDLEKGIRVTQTNVNSVPSSQGSDVTKVNIDISNKEERALTSAAVPGCGVSVIQANTLNMKDLNKADPVFTSSANGTNDIRGVISVRGNSKQGILTKSSTDANCFNVSNISSDNSNIAYNDTVCVDNLDNGNKTWQETGISCPRFIQSKILMLSDSCDTEIRKPLSDVNKLVETAPPTNKQPGSNVGPSQKDLVVCPLPNSMGLDHIKNVINIGSDPDVQQSLMSRDEDEFDIELLSYSAVSGGHAIVYTDQQWESKLSAVSSALGSPPHEKSVTDKSRLKTYSKKNSPTSLTDQTKNQKSPCHANSQVLFDRPSAVNFEEDVYVKKGSEATVAAASTLCHSDQHNEEHVPVGDGSSHECGNSVLEERQSDQALPQEDSKDLRTLATGAVADTKLIDVDTCPDGDEVHITQDFTSKQETDVCDSGIVASADHLSPGVHNSAVVEENENFHCAKFIDQSESASESSEVQKCVGIANTSTQNSEITVSSVSDGSFMATSVENICDDSQENNKQPFCNVQMNVYELESSKEEQNELTTKPSIDNFVQEMNIDYISSEADKFIIEDESLSMYLNNSDEFQDKNLLENDTALMPIGSCERNQHTVTSNKSPAEETVSTIVKENNESTTLKNTVNCDMLSTERRETNILTPVSFDERPDVAGSTEVGKTRITTETEESEEPAETNTQSKDDERHSSCCGGKSTAITSIASDKQVMVLCSSTNVTDEAIDNSDLSTTSLVDGSVKKDVTTLCEKQLQEEHEASIVVNTTDTISDMEETPCTLCTVEQNSSVSVIRSPEKCLNDGTEHYDRTEEYNSSNNSFDLRETGVNLNNMDTKTGVASEYLPIADPAISNRDRKEAVLDTSLIKECKSKTEDFKSSCLHPEVANDVKSGKTTNIPMCQEHLCTDSNETKSKDEPDEESIETHDVFLEGNSSSCVRETTVKRDVEIKNPLPTECSLKCVPPVSDEMSKAAAPADSLIKECKSESEDVKHSGLQNVAAIADDVKEEKPTNIPLPEIHLYRESREVTDVSVKCEDCTENPSNPAAEKEGCEDENLGNMKAGAVVEDANEPSQDQQTDLSQKLVCRVTSSRDMEDRLIAVHPDTSSHQLISDTATLKSSEDTSHTDNNKKLSGDGNPASGEVVSICGSSVSTDPSGCNSNSLETCNGEDTSSGSSVNAVSVGSECGTSGNQQLDYESVVCIDKIEADSKEECTTARRASSISIPPVKEFLKYKEHLNDNSEQPTGNTVKSENYDDDADFNKSLCHLCDSVADKVETDVDEMVSADTSLMLAHTDSEADVLNCKNVTSVNNEESASRKLKSDNIFRNGYLCDKEISVIDNRPSSESEENSKEHENVQNLSLPRDYKDIMASSDDECKEKKIVDGNSQIPVKAFIVQDSANITVTHTMKQEVNSSLVPTESMIIDLKLNAGSDVTVCNASVLGSAPEAVKTKSSPISVKENIEIVSCTGTSTSATLSENTASVTTLSSETEEPAPTLLQVNEKSSSEALCDVSKNTSSPLTASKICRKRKNSECTNMDNSHSKVQILEFGSDKLAKPSSVKASVETAPYHSGSDESHREETSTENVCKLQLSCNVSNSSLMSAAGKCENTEETSGSLKTSATDDDGDTTHCHEYSEFRKTRDVSDSKVCSLNDEELENNSVEASEVTKSNNNRLSHNNCNDTVGAERIMGMDGTESGGALQGVVHGQKRTNSEQELHIPENCAEMPLDKKRYISSPVQITEYPDRPDRILESVALCSTKVKAELSTAKCVYNTRHKGTLHTVLKLDQASGFCSPVIGRGRGRGRGRGIVKEETTEEGVGSPPGDRGRGKEGLRGRGRGRARGRGRGRGRGGGTQEPGGGLAPPEVTNTTGSDIASSGTVLAVKRKRGRPSLKPQPAERTQVGNILHGEKKENVSHDSNTNTKSSSSATNADANESEENDKVTAREGEDKNECKNIHTDLQNKPFLKENGGGYKRSPGRGRGKQSKIRNDKIMVSNDSMFSSEDEQSKERNANDDNFEDAEYSPQRTKRGKREERRASTSKTPSKQNGKSHEDNIINESFDSEGSKTVTTKEGDQNNVCKNIKSEIQDESFLKENEERVMTSQRKDSGKLEEARNDKIMVSNDSMFSSEDGQSKEGNTVEDSFEDDEYSPQRSTRGKRGARRASTNKIPSKRNGKSHKDNIINENFDLEGSDTGTKRKGDQSNECKYIIPHFEEELFLKEDEDKATASLRRSSGRRGRSRNYIMTQSNESMFSNDEETDEGNAVDDTFEDEEYLPEPRIRATREGRRTSNRASGIQGEENYEDSMTNENCEEVLFPAQHGRRATRQGRRGKSSTEQSGEGSFSDESCEDKEYSPYRRRKGQVRKKTGNFGKRRAKGRGRGRGRGTTCDKGEGLPIAGEDFKEIQVKCGKCAEEMTNRSFDSHNYQKHNGLSWIEGQEPIDTSDEKIVQRILFKMRKQGKKTFVCEICDDVKKSVVGFMSHLQFCQKSTEEREAMKERCPFCDRCLIPASMKVHLQLHKSEQERQQQEEELISSSNQARKHKRAAAQKAATLMQEFIKGGEDDEPSEEQKDKDELFKQLGYTRPTNSLLGRWRMAIFRNGKIKCNNPGCVFDTSEVGEMELHYADCPNAPRKGYVCKLCDHRCNQEAEIREHLKEHEKSNPAEETDSSGVEEDFDGEVFHERTGVLTSLRVGKPKKQRYKVANKMNFLAREASGSVVGDRVFAAALRWTAKFHIQHYKDSLFPLYHTSLEDWTAVEESLIEEYLPAAKESMMISHVTMKGKVVDLNQHNMEWRKYNLFEAAVKDDAVTVFIGGPVWAMAWCPLPFRLQIQEDPQNTKQYLAITCHKSMEDQYSTSRSYIGPGLIQIWCFEDLDNLKSPPIPSLAFAIAHNYGAIWCMEWCPSGCYERRGCDTEEEHLRRLGLLAAACSDGCVHIFSVCHPDEVVKHECDRYPVFKAEPVVSLMLEEEEDTKLGGTDWQCLRLSWSKVNGHRIIAGSFSNGMVALWDIETSSRLLYRICGKRKLIYPYHTFQPHGGPVTALAMYPLNERFLMTGSYDRTCKFWDTHDTAEPITSTFKGLVTDGVWLTHWPSAVSAYDDVYSRCHTNATLTPVRNFGYQPYPLLAQNSVAWAISSSDWVNSVAQGTSAGELSAIFLHQLLICVDTEKGMKNKRMILSYAELVSFKESVSTSEVTESAGKGEEDTVEQQVPAADAPSLAPPDAQASFGADSGRSSENEYVASCTHSDSACGSSTGRRVDELVLSESRDDDRSVNDAVPTVKQEKELDESRQTNDISMNENFIDVEELQNTDQFPEDVTCASLNSVRDCDTDPLACDDSQSVLTSPSCSQASDVSKQCDSTGVTSKQSDSEKSAEATQEKFVLNPRTYSEVEKSFGVVLCDFPTDDFSQMPKEARLWMRQSDQMRMFPTEMYPVLSINRVAWNPNFRSFLWVASGYQNGLVRLKCVSAMYTQDVAKNVLRLKDAYS